MLQSNTVHLSPVDTQRLTRTLYLLALLSAYLRFRIWLYTGHMDCETQLFMWSL